jgi:hypothetical protein
MTHGGSGLGLVGGSGFCSGSPGSHLRRYSLLSRSLFSMFRPYKEERRSTERERRGSGHGSLGLSGHGSSPFLSLSWFRSLFLSLSGYLSLGFPVLFWEKNNWVSLPQLFSLTLSPFVSLHLTVSHSHTPSP